MDDLVESVAMSTDFLGDGCRAGGCRDVALHDLDVCTGSLDFGCDLACRRVGADVVDQHMLTGRGEPECDGASDAAAAAGYQQGHGVPITVWSCGLRSCMALLLWLPLN